MAKKAQSHRIPWNACDYENFQPEADPSAGTSIFDPVLCEAVYTWFCPPGGSVLDPFAGGSVRGIVAAELGRQYTGVELSEVQVEANRQQALAILEKPAARIIELPGAPPPSWNAEGARSQGRPVLTPKQTSDSAAAFLATELYNATSSIPFQKHQEGPDELRGYLEKVYSGAGQELAFESNGPADYIAELRENNTCWVMFSGGKDSVAAALRAERQGYTIICYHLAGLNRGMQDELDYAKAICQKRGWDLVVDRVSISGKKSGLIELPTKNQVTALFMAARMAEMGGSTWTAGYVSTATLASGSITWNVNFTDSVELITLFDNYLEAIYPGIHRLQLLDHQLDSWAEVAAEGLINYVKGCVCPPRFKDQRRGLNEEKFGPLPNGRCGSCVKCAWELDALDALGILPLHRALRDHIAPFLQEFEKEPGEDLHQIRNRLVPGDRVASLRRSDWPDQPLPSPLPPPSATAAGGAIWIEGDSRNISDLAPGDYDLLFTCPPYADLECYSDDPRDLSTLDYEDFRTAYGEIIAAACSLLKDDRWAVVVVGDIRDKQGNYRNFVSHTIEAFEAAGLHLYNEAILITAHGSLPIRAGKQFTASRKLGKTHQNVLVFVKGDGKAATEACGPVHVAEEVGA